MSEEAGTLLKIYDLLSFYKLKEPGKAWLIFIVIHAIGHKMISGHSGLS